MTDPLLSPFDSRRRAAMRRALQRWFVRHRRPLPWRESADPYRIWISEIMLQQTTVQAVIPYFERFLSRFPTLEELARAEEQEVLQYWEGLGYYSRGRNLHRAARIIRERHGGQFPNELDDLCALPGIGRYTAGAIRSFAFHLPAPIVEANTLRLYCRLLGYDGDPRSRAGEELLWDFAERLQPRPTRISSGTPPKTSPGELNQALMELGSLVCTPRQPRCDVCPLKRFCAACASSRQEEIPRRKSRPEVTPLVEATVAIQSGDRYLLRRRDSNERWAGLWDFIRFPVEAVTDRQRLTPKTLSGARQAVTSGLAEHAPVAASSPEFVTEFRHSVTRYRIRLLCWTARREGDLGINGSTDPDRFRWLTLDELEQAPMPVSGRRFATILADAGPAEEETP
jgi:A/G-specific adenine glycosylase